MHRDRRAPACAAGAARSRAALRGCADVRSRREVETLEEPLQNLQLARGEANSAFAKRLPRLEVTRGKREKRVHVHRCIELGALGGSHFGVEMPVFEASSENIVIDAQHVRSV